MVKTNRYKAKLLGFILDFLYPDDPNANLMPDWPANLQESYKQLLRKQYEDFPGSDKLRPAVLDVLTAHISKQQTERGDSIRIIERAANEPIRLVPALTSQNSSQAVILRIDPTPQSAARSIAEHLLRYFDEKGECGSICSQCRKIYLKLKSNQEYCSEGCRWKYWNAKKMDGYHARKAKESREHKKRVKKMKGGKH